jgi:hypothetical protein
MVAISKMSSRNMPLLAGMINVTAEARIRYAMHHSKLIDLLYLPARFKIEKSEKN